MKLKGRNNFTVYLNNEILYKLEMMKRIIGDNSTGYTAIIRFLVENYPEEILEAKRKSDKNFLKVAHSLAEAAGRKK